MTHCGIYIIQSKKKPKRIYVGNSINIERRWRLHTNSLKANKHHSVKLQRHFNKYGLDELDFKIVCECDSIDLVQHEQFFIDIYKPYFNCSPTAGSTLGSKRTPEQMEHLRGWKHTEEAKKKMSESRKGIKPSKEFCEHMRQIRTGWRLSEETKKKISESHKGIVNGPEAIEKIRQANLGRKNPHTEEWNKKIGASQKGRKLTEEHKAKLRKAKIGYVPWNKGKKTGQRIWNKGKKGLQQNWKKGMKKINGKYVLVDAA